MLCACDTWCTAWVRSAALSPDVWRNMVHDVVAIARGAHLDAVREHGLRLESPADALTITDMQVVADPSEVDWRPDDIAILAMKSQDTIAAVNALVAHAPGGIGVVCMQNGVENERVALRRFARVYAVPVMCPAQHVEPGVVQATSAPISGILDVGRYPSGIDDTCVALSDALNASTFVSQPRPDVMRWKYRKLLMNLANSVEALCGRVPEAAPISKRARAEGSACLEAAGIDVASSEEDRERRGNLLTPGPINGRERGGGSSWQSLARRTGAIESDFLNGEIVLLGRNHAVPTPVNERLQHLANEAAAARRQPGSVTPEEVLAGLD